MNKWMEGLSCKDEEWMIGLVYRVELRVNEWMV